MNKQPIVFDIDVKPSSPARSPPIALKLKNRKLHPATLEEIESKLNRAEELRNQQLKAHSLTDDKLKEVIERKVANDKEQAQKLIETIENKQETAEQLRAQTIEKKISLAKKYSDKLDKALQHREEIAADKENKLRQDNELKLAQAQERVAELQEQILSKVKTHIQKVMETVELQKAKKANELEDMKQEMIQKQQKAEQARQQVLEEKVAKAQECRKLRSKSNDAPKPNGDE
jgi:hypothetical protein